MGTTTDYAGQFVINKPLDAATYDLLVALAKTKRMKRHVNPRLYGLEGEFYVAEDNAHVIADEPPASQPSRWLQWIPTEDKKGIRWNGG